MNLLERRKLFLGFWLMGWGARKPISFLGSAKMVDRLVHPIFETKALSRTWREPTRSPSNDMIYYNQQWQQDLHQTTWFTITYSARYFTIKLVIYIWLTGWLIHFWKQETQGTYRIYYNHWCQAFYY